MHLLDSGLAATLADLTERDWLRRRQRMGRLLEFFVVQQLVAQASWTDPLCPKRAAAHRPAPASRRARAVTVVTDRRCAALRRFR